MSVTLPDQEVFSTGELATLCHVTKHTIISAIDKGDLRATRTPGGHNRIYREDAIEFLRKCRALPEEDESQGILVVDDEDFVHLVVQRVFNRDGYEIHHATTGYEAGKLAERFRPDLIVLDIMLPDIDGRDVCRHIREEKFGKQCRILALTALNDEENVEEIYESGIDDYLAKPFRIEVLREKVEALIEAPASNK